MFCVLLNFFVVFFLTSRQAGNTWYHNLIKPYCAPNKQHCKNNALVKKVIIKYLFVVVLFYLFELFILNSFLCEFWALISCIFLIKYSGSNTKSV